MTIGFCRLTLFLADSGSLKHKRGILKSLTSRVRNRFNVSVAEVADNDVWQKAVLGVAVVANDSRYANQVLSKVVSLVESDPRLQVVDYSLEML